MKGFAMFCGHCGQKNADDAQFCGACGSPLHQSAEVQGNSAKPTDRATTPMPAPVLPPRPESAASTSSTPGAGTTPTTTIPAPASASPAVPTPDTPNTEAVHRSKAVIAAIVATALVVVAGITAGLTYRAELWGGKTLPDIAAETPKTSKQSGNAKAAVTADSVVVKLRASGITAIKKPEFSGAAKGAFLGYGNAKAGQRVSTTTKITVRESAGPGVPANIEHAKASTALTTLKTMGVPVHTKQIAVGASSKLAGGTVVATYPLAGQAVTDTTTGIYIGIAEKTDGKTPAVPYDAVGTDINSVKDTLAKAGVKVTVKPHFSSTKNVGKLVTSSPAPGTVLSSGENVTLYYGVGADKVQDATVGQSNLPYFYASELNDAVTGTYCKSTVNDTAKDCITLAQDDNGSVYRVTAKDTGTSSEGHTDHLLAMCFPFADGNAGDIGTCSYGGSQLPAGEGGMAKRLIAKKWGAFDFGELGGSPSCGTATSFYFDEGCNASKQVVQDSRDMSGATFDMHDFYVFFASEANLDAIEKSGYFDDSALATAKKASKPDTSRPFILARDASQYDTTSVPYNKAPVPSGQTLVQDPFVPGVGEFSASVKFKPAPTDANAYYLVESAQPDWQSLPDCDANGKVSEAAAQEQGFWRQVKGKYIFSVGAGAWSTIMTVNADGSFSADYHDSDLGVTGDGYPNGSRAIASGTGKFTYTKRNNDGSFSITCDTKAFHQDGTIGDVTIKDGVRIETVDGIYGLTPCGTFTVYPAGYATSALSDDVKGWMYGVVGGSLPATLTGPLIVNDSGMFAFVYDQN
ncbi:PASTA domain-containing protein [Bifidobacterium boum]|uniref:PASTA domain-containing protein n=1 Tax=Bifidobacterium boum TaxID=78343 RepID=UPI003F93A104